MSLPSSPPDDRVARRSGFAWLVWAAATAASLVFVAVLGIDVPFWDEWELVPAATGHQPVTGRFLWSLHNEHRIPLPRLVYLGVFALGGGDFRAGMAFNVLALSASAALLMGAAARARGEGAWTDGAIALLLLHPGQAENLLWGFQIPLVLFTLLQSVILAAVLRLEAALGRGQALAIGTASILLPLCGAPGIAVAPVLGLWLLLRATRGPAGSGGPGTAGRPLLLGLGSSAMAVCGLYLVGYHGNPLHPDSAGVLPSLRAAAEFLAVALGPAAGWHLRPAVALLTAALAATAAGAGWWWWRSPERRNAAEGLLAFFAAGCGLALMIGWGRSGFGPGAALAPRYVALSVPLVCWVYLAWCRLPWPRAGRAVQVAIFAAAAGLYPGNFSSGADYGHARRDSLQGLVRDIEAGRPLAEAAAAHSPRVYPDPTILAARLRMLRERRLGPFSPAARWARYQRLYPFLDAPLVAIREGMLAPRVEKVQGRRVLVVHAEGDLVFDVRPGTRQASGYFGVLTEPLARPVPPEVPGFDGITFVATFRPDEGAAIALFERSLDPLRDPAQGGLQPFSLLLPGDGGRLVLGTRYGRPGTGAGAYGDWGYWTGVVLR